jgi:hypothetical protein
MTKTEADNIKKISTSFLRKHGYFIGWKSGTITWTRSGFWGEDKSSVGVEVSTMNDENYLRIHYTQTDNNTQEKKNFDYKIPLITTPCPYGGKRYWFTCPMSRNGKYCGRKVSVIYKDGDYFACRHCYNLTYSSRNQGGRYKGFLSMADVDEAREKVKRYHYRGKPTKKYLRYLKISEKFDRDFERDLLKLNSRIERVEKRKK